MGWERVELNKVCFIDKKRYVKNNLPYVGLENIESNTGKLIDVSDTNLVKSSTFYFDQSHLLYGRLRPYLNKVALPDFEGHCSSEIFPLKCKNTLLKEFLFYWLTFSRTVDKINETCTGARMPRANVKEIMTFPIPLPPLPEQKRLVHLLDTAFAKIERARELLARNLVNAGELFESRLVNILSSKKEGWKVKTLKEVCSVITDGTHQTPKYFDSGYIFLSSRNVKTGKIDWDNIKYIDEEQHQKMYGRLAPQIGDVLLAKNGTTGVAAIVDIERVFDIYVSLALLRPTSEIYPEFLLRFVNSPVAKKQFNSRLKGSGVPNLHLKEIREVRMAFPESLKKQEKVANEISAFKNEIDKAKDKYKTQLAHLTELKQSLLAQVFAGEL